MYLKPEEGHELTRRLTGHFVHGIIAFDAFNRLTIRVQHLNPAARGCGARMSWGIDDPAELDRASPRLHCLERPRPSILPRWPARAAVSGLVQVRCWHPR